MFKGGRQSVDCRPPVDDGEAINVDDGEAINVDDGEAINVIERISSRNEETMMNKEQDEAAKVKETP